MPYHAAVSLELAAMVGYTGPVNTEPHITCDACGTRLNIITRKGYPASWFMNRRNPPGTGWRITWWSEGGVSAWCPRCKPIPAAVIKESK